MQPCPARYVSAAVLALGSVSLALGLSLGSPVCRADEAAASPNLVANGDFAQIRDGKPINWDISGNPKDVDQRLELGQDAQGKSFARLVCTRCEKAGGWSHAMLLQLGQVTLVKGRAYEFSCRMRQEGIRSRTVGVAIQDTKTWTPGGLQAQFSVGRAWQTQRQTFYAERDIGPAGRLQIWFTESGTLEVTDVHIVEVRQSDVEFTDVVRPQPGQGPNLVYNGSFELGPVGWSSKGTGAGWGDLDCLHGQVVSAPEDTPNAQGAAHGRNFLRIALGGEHTPVLYFDYFEPAANRQLRPLAATMGWIPVRARQAYTLSCLLRASIEGTRAVLVVHGEDPATGRTQDYRREVTLTKTWRPYALTFRPRQPYAFVMIGPSLTEERRVDVDLDAVQLEEGEQGTEFRPRWPVELALASSADAGVFLRGRPASIALCAASGDPTSPARVNVVLDVEDYQGTSARWTEKTLHVPAGSTIRQDVAIPAGWRGYYRIRAKATDAAGTPIPAGPAGTADLRIAIVPRRSARDSLCGVNHAFVSSRLIDLASKAGVTCYRDWSLKWQHIEPARGQYRWDIGDVQIDRVLQRGMHVLPLLPPFPSADWCSEAPAGLPTTGYPGVRLRQAWGPHDTSDLAGFVEKAVSRYKGRVRVWEFLNEPIYTNYALPADHENRYGGRKYTPADYVHLLAVASAAMKKADPTCRVVGGIGAGPERLAEQVIDAGCLKHVDIFNLHIYPGRRPPESFADDMDRLLARMDAGGWRKPIWITEFSYYGTDDLPRRPFVPGRDSWSGVRLLNSERQCADWTVRFFAVMLARGVEKVFIHSGASGSVNHPDSECCLFEYGGPPRKVFAALAVMTELLGEKPVPAGVRRLGQIGHAVAFETGGPAVLVVWAEEDQSPEGQAVALPVDRPPQVLDLMGRLMSGSSIAISPSPVYLVGPAGTAKALLQGLKPCIRLPVAGPPQTGPS